MKTTNPSTQWIESNQAYLTGEFNRLKARFNNTGEAPEPVAVKKKSASSKSPAIERLVQAFRLSQFEKDLLLLCAGVEMDSELAAACAEALGNPTRPYVTMGLALGMLEEAHWSALSPSGPLRHWRFLEVETGTLLTASPLKIDERVLHYLAGLNPTDGRLRALIRHYEA